ncbi:response regulator transcription factor [Nitratireductor sp. GISD-1A_MAKvit]|uniref:response regulator transcription factor n=1 Tax=Nitratireductor sp. GISD-1A_MAKvit TaxID=3234198 RepID=UPI003466B6DE
MEQAKLGHDSNLRTMVDPAEGALAVSGNEDWETIENDAEREIVLLIDPRVLDRECLARSLETQNSSLEIIAVGSAEEWHRIADGREPEAVLLIAGSRKITDQGICAEIHALAEEFSQHPVVVIADTDDLGQILKALEAGARGYIPSNVGVGVAAEAILLARAGGVFVPASGVLAMRDVINSNSSRVVGLGNLFTAREAEVAEALRRGKANKIIAYELQLCESTVKVHIRNIMKKLNATNRTEVAYKIREMQS